MSSVPVKKNQPEGYGPDAQPEFVTKAQQTAQNLKYNVYEDIEYRIDIVELKESFRFAGVKLSEYPNFANIGRYGDVYKPLLQNHWYKPYTEIGYNGTYGTGQYDYLFGCQLDRMDNLPEGLTAFDTGLKRFVCITFRAKSSYALVGGSDGPGDAMVTAEKYMKEVWLPAHRDEVQLASDDGLNVMFEQNGKTEYCGLIEVYKVDINQEHEMCFYFPLKEK